MSLRTSLGRPNDLEKGAATMLRSRPMILTSVESFHFLFDILNYLRSEGFPMAVPVCVCSAGLLADGPAFERWIWRRVLANALTRKQSGKQSAVELTAYQRCWL